MDILLEPTVTPIDITLVGDDLMADNGLSTAIIVSLLSDARAEAFDELPAGVTERRGWWPDTRTDRFGSLLWLLSREKTTEITAARAEAYARQALQWMVDDGIAGSVVVTAEIVDQSTIGISASIQRGSNRKYDYLWRGMVSGGVYTITVALDYVGGKYTVLNAN